MSADRKEYLKAYCKRWYVEVVVPRRVKWFEENGPCRSCGSWENLELDLIDPATKVHHAIWSWSDQRREEELSKCQPLCSDCHLKKSIQDRINMGAYETLKKRIIDGKTWCKNCQDMVPVENFDKDKYAFNGCYSVCKDCRRNLPSRISKKAA